MDEFVAVIGVLTCAIDACGSNIAEVGAAVAIDIAMLNKTMLLSCGTRNSRSF